MDWITSTNVNLQLFLTPPTWGSRPLVISCRHFLADETDIVIKHIGGSDADKYLTIPTYAAVDLNYVRQAIQNNIRHYTEEFFKHSIQSDSCSIVQKTLQMALKFGVCDETHWISRLADSFPARPSQIPCCDSARHMDREQALCERTLIDGRRTSWA